LDTLQNIQKLPADQSTKRKKTVSEVLKLRLTNYNNSRHEKYYKINYTKYLEKPLVNPLHQKTKKKKTN